MVWGLEARAYGASSPGDLGLGPRIKGLRGLGVWSLLVLKGVM